MARRWRHSSADHPGCVCFNGQPIIACSCVFGSPHYRVGLTGCSRLIWKAGTPQSVIARVFCFAETSCIASWAPQVCRHSIAPFCRVFSLGHCGSLPRPTRHQKWLPHTFASCSCSYCPHSPRTASSLLGFWGGFSRWIDLSRSLPSVVWCGLAGIPWISLACIALARVSSSGVLVASLPTPLPLLAQCGPSHCFFGVTGRWLEIFHWV